MNNIYRFVVDADRLRSDHCLVVGFNIIPNSSEADWVGSIYVKSPSEQLAIVAVSNFIDRQALEWSFDGDARLIRSLSEYELEEKAMMARGDVDKLMSGGVVVGWGM